MRNGILVFILNSKMNQYVKSEFEKTKICTKILNFVYYQDRLSLGPLYYIVCTYKQCANVCLYVVDLLPKINFKSEINVPLLLKVLRRKQESSIKNSLNNLLFFFVSFSVSNFQENRSIGKE